MKLTPTQIAHLETGKRIAEAHRENKRTADDRHRIMKEKELAASQHEVDRQIRVMADAGIPKKQIHEALKMSPNTVYEALARMESIPLTPDVEQVAASDRFTWADDAHDRIMVTLAGAEWDEMRREMEPKIRRNGEENSAVYRVTDEGVIPRTDSFDATNVNRYDHPVTAWLLFHGGLNEAHAWIAAQGEGIAA